KDMHRADKPMLMGHVELDPGADRKHSWTAYQGDVVKIDDIELAVLDNPPDAPAIHDRPARLLRQQGRETTQAAFQTLHRQAFRLWFGRRLGATVQQVVCVYVVNHGDLVATAHQAAREPLDSDRITTEMVRGIERGEHTKLKRSGWHAVA